MKERSTLLDIQERIRAHFWLFPLSLLLRLFSYLFFVASQLRKWFLQTFCLFDSPIPLISIGSVTVGGAGKTPVILLLMKRLSKYRLGYVSRGYGREQQGEVIASCLASSSMVGDEAFLLLHEIPSLVVAVGDSKRKSIERLLGLPLNFIFIDDALQRYNIKAQKSIGVLPDRLLFEKEYLLPFGLLREPIGRLQKVDLLFIVKESTDRSVEEIQTKARSLAPVVIVEHTISGWKDINGDMCAPPSRKIALLCGIARPHRVMDFLERQGYIVIEARSHGDHSSIVSQDVLHWAKKWHEQGVSVVATAKDWARHVPWSEEWQFCTFLHTELVPIAGEDVLDAFLVGLI